MLVVRAALAHEHGRVDVVLAKRCLGDDDGLGGALKGLVIATRDGAQVTSPVDGKVEFAGPFRSYGEVLILNPGGGYHILLAGLGRITAATGEFLRAGEPVGEMGAGPSSVTLLGDAVGDKRPVLYIEFRNGSSAVDLTILSDNSSIVGGTFGINAGNDGSALRWGEQLGAASADLGAYQGHGSWAVPQGALISWP